ncbi:MAG: hypothetical protein VXU42_07080, partial [Verrucomicrobiota bacterium]|nr:hypothetical protein [Verrucomicrobiota bacterium]
EGTVAYIDVEGSLLTSSGGKFGRTFDDLLKSFYFEQLVDSHHVAHVAPASFSDVSDYDLAFTAVTSCYTSIHPKLAALKPKLAELAPLLASSSSSSSSSSVAKAEQAIDKACDELRRLLPGEDDEHLAAACTHLRKLAYEARTACQTKGAAKGATAAGKLAGGKASAGAVGLLERLTRALAMVAH